MKIPLDLSRHCIETSAKLRLERIIRSYFKHLDPETDKEIRALTYFLEHGDFPTLRTQLNGIDGAVLVFSKEYRSINIKTSTQNILMTWEEQS